MRILLVSTYEMGHQPLGLAAPAAALRAAGHRVRTLDLAIESLHDERFADVDLVAISIPMHTAARLGIELARLLRRLRPTLRIALYGLYAAPLYERLSREGLADAIIGGEVEPALVALADRLAAGGGRSADIDGVGPRAAFPRQQYPVPDRRGLPPLNQYARLRVGDQEHLAGYVEASRGCAHHCTHCPLTPAYGGRLRIVQRETVLADIAQLAAAGAEHITFGDPDFFNALPHSLAIVEEMRRRHPQLTFDATIKVEHLLEHAAALPRLRELGCQFITSAFESTNDATLRLLEKGHTCADMEHALELADTARIPLRPTWVAFTPWTSADDLLTLLAFIELHGLVEHVEPVQYGIRLLLPPGSPLVAVLERERRLGPFDDEALTYTWRNEDSRLDALQAALSEIVESSATASCSGDPATEIFRRVKAAALTTLRGHMEGADVAPQPVRVAPRLTEAWFCCAEPTTAQLAPLAHALGRRS